MTEHPPTGDPLGAWLRRRSYLRPLYGTAERGEAKAGRRVSVIIPTLDEAPTIGAIVRTIHTDPDSSDLVDQVLVIDSGSTDGTPDAARKAGAEVVDHRDVRPDLGTIPGKGEGMWKALDVATGDLIVYVDGDLENFTGEWVARLVEPLLADDTVRLVKGSFDRPLGPEVNRDGGRVTQLVARPMLAAFFPELLGLRQPLAGEIAARRADLVTLPFASGFGVDIGLVLDVYTRWGADALAQVELGERRHSHHSTEELARMAVTVLYTMLRRAGVDAPSATEFVQVVHTDEAMDLERFPIPVEDRPPLADT